MLDARSGRRRPMTAWTPRHLSVSSVELYARCAAQWKRRYVEGIIDPPNRAMAWGSAFHAALEAGHKGRDVEQAWLSAWNVWRQKVEGPFWPTKSYGLALLERFIDRGLMAQCSAEVRFSLPFPRGVVPIPLLGYIDAVLPEEVREYKTTKGGWWNENRAAMAHQAHVYGWAYQRLYQHRVPIRYVIFGTRAPTIDEYVVSHSPDGFRVFEQLSESVWSGIINERFVGCGECFVCDPTSTKPAADESMFEWDLE